MRHRIYIVEDHPTMQATYKMFIEQDPALEVCGMATTGASALAEIPTLAPDLVIVDLALPDVNGMDVIRELHTRYPDLPILVISGNRPRDFAERVVRAGAAGYVDKQDAPTSMIPAIKRLLGEH